MNGASFVMDVAASLGTLDFTNGPGVVYEDLYQDEIHDLILREGTPLAQRIRAVPATGYPSRYYEQTTLPGAPQFTGTAGAPKTINPAVATNPTRSAKALMLKGVEARFDLGLFDRMVMQQQGNSWAEGKDFEDLVVNTFLFHADNLVNGSDTSLTTPTTNEYVGLTTQITTLTASISSGNIVDAIKTQIATMSVSNTSYRVRPSAIYLHPLTIDQIEKQEKSYQRHMNTVEILPGVQVSSIPTQAGVLPIIADPFLPDATISVADDARTGFILTENLIEYHYLGDAPAQPMVFRLGTTVSLAQSDVLVMFGAPVVKSAAIAHAKIKVLKTL